MAEERISVSKDFIRAELGDLELRLVDKLATKAELAVLRKEHELLRDKVDGLESWRAYLMGLTAGSVGLAATAVAFATHLF